MSTVIENALDTLTRSVNLSTGLNHPNDMNKARDLFRVLHANGRILTKAEIENAALARNWGADSADELGSIGQQIGMGKAPRVAGGPWWAVDIYDKIAAGASDA